MGLFSKADSIWLLFSDVPFEFAFGTGGLGAFLSSWTVFCVSLGIRNRVINLHMHIVNLIGVYICNVKNKETYTNLLLTGGTFEAELPIFAGLSPISFHRAM